MPLDHQDPITRAANLLREAAYELQLSHTSSRARDDWAGEPEAKAAYHEHIGAAAALEEFAASLGAGGVAPLIGKPQAMPDLSQLTERGQQAWAGVDAQALREGRVSTAASAGSEPVAWLVCTEEGDPDMVFLSQHEAQQYLEDDERPTPLYLHPSPTTAEEVEHG